MTTVSQGGADHPSCAAGSLLEKLPDELLQLIVAHLNTAALHTTALASRTLHRHATDRLWQTVCLSDQRTRHTTDSLDPDDPLCDDDEDVADEHDDRPMIEKLYLLATNPALAAKVQTLTHRCHLPTPNIFTELPRLYFDADSLSADPRLHKLVRAAVRNLVNVHTLRIVYGHWHLTTTLISAFLHHDRPREVPLRKLWLESCAFDIPHPSFLGPAALTGLESLRLRRLRAEPSTTPTRRYLGHFEMRLARAGHYHSMHDGAGAWLTTTVEFSLDDQPSDPAHHHSIAALQANRVKAFDALTWTGLDIISSYVETLPDHVSQPPPTASPTAPIAPMHWLFQCSQSTLTRLDLDWILWRSRDHENESDASSAFLRELAAMRFPNLVAFQMRNAVLPLTKLPDDVFLLEDTFLAFMEAHPRIRCLAWPLDRFYNHTRPTTEIRSRCRSLIAHLAMVLTDLRLDTYYIGNGEPKTDDSTSVEAVQQRIRRRRFIAEFAPHMRKVKQIKLEGGIPRDEKREMLRALHYCPLRKIVFIGVSFPVGNTWGAGGAHLKALDAGHIADFPWELEQEDSGSILCAYRHPPPIPEPFDYLPQFGWATEPPLLQTLALHHASTIQELKICGYNGCPILSHPNSDTTLLLAPLLQLPNLRHLVISFWLLTFFEDAYRDVEIIRSWKDTRSPQSTALVVITPPRTRTPSHDHPVDAAMMPAPPPTAPRQSFNRWAVALKTRFTPSALAYRVARHISPFLHPDAKAQIGGVRVRASFCLGAGEERRVANDIFDLDFRLGGEDQVLQFVGPREEGERGRWWAKLEGRAWF